MTAPTWAPEAANYLNAKNILFYMECYDNLTRMPLANVWATQNLNSFNSNVCIDSNIISAHILDTNIAEKNGCKQRGTPSTETFDQDTNVELSTKGGKIRSPYLKITSNVI
ncbi:hypothetical protein SK128_025847, partial [Halocaridina rubra]